MGYGGRVKNAFGGVVMGLVFSAGSFFIHGYNEKDAIKHTASITQADKVALADVPSNEVDSLNDGKLVHMNGTAVTDDILEEPMFGIEENAIQLRWKSEIYQLKESSSKDDDGHVTYSYSEVWTSDVINSSGFNKSSRRDANTGSQKTLSKSDSRYAQNVDFGAFQLSSKLIRAIQGEEDYPLQTIPVQFEGKGSLVAGTYFTGDSASPKIGDEKISFHITRPPKDATVLAAQKGTSFAAWTAKAGKSYERLWMGMITKAEVISKLRTEAFLLRWGLRLLGFVLLWMGLGLIFKPIQALASFVPFLSGFVGAAISVVTFFFAAGVTLITIGVFWFAYRPLLSGTLFTIAALCLGAMLYMRKQKQDQPLGSSATPPPPPLPGN